MKNENKSSGKKCVRCGNEFVCKPNDILHCDCRKIELNKEEYIFINTQFADCACNNCLKELKAEYKTNQYSRNSNYSTVLAFLFFVFTCLFTIEDAGAQNYAPPAGQPGTSAIYKDSSVFVSWVLNCEVNRGYQDISDHSLGFASIGDNSMATGKAQSNGVLSLGDGGSAICTFAKPIKDEPGFDFAVFENGFDDVFLELAFVEVSSDGIHYFRFPSHSLSDTNTQTDGFGSTDATKINNLAGKYRGGYGTPFDLQELAGETGLDIHRITHVKIIDVVGSLNNTYASRDVHGNKINDPWPTPFPSGGFDLDAVGVIHENMVVGLPEISLESQLLLYPNPAPSNEEIQIQSSLKINFTEVYSAQGNLIGAFKPEEISVKNCAPGLYFIRLYTASGTFTKRLLIL